MAPRDLDSLVKQRLAVRGEHASRDGDHVGPRASKRLGPAPAERQLRLRAPVEDQPFGVDRDEGRQGGPDDAVHALLALDQRLLGAATELQLALLVQAHQRTEDRGEGVGENAEQAYLVTAEACRGRPRHQQANAPVVLALGDLPVGRSELTRRGPTSMPCGGGRRELGDQVARQAVRGEDLAVAHDRADLRGEPPGHGPGAPTCGRRGVGRPGDLAHERRDGVDRPHVTSRERRRGDRKARHPFLVDSGAHDHESITDAHARWATCQCSGRGWVRAISWRDSGSALEQLSHQRRSHQQGRGGRPGRGIPRFRRRASAQAGHHRLHRSGHPAPRRRSRRGGLRRLDRDRRAHGRSQARGALGGLPGRGLRRRQRLRRLRDHGPGRRDAAAPLA